MLSWGLVGKTDITLDISNEEDIIQKIGDAGVRDLKEQKQKWKCPELRNTGSSSYFLWE